VELAVKQCGYYHVLSEHYQLKVANSGGMILSVGDGQNAFLEANKPVVIQAMLSFKWYS